MAKTISTGFMTDKINGIAVNSSLQCNPTNYNNADRRNIAYVVMHYTGNSKDTAKANANYFKGANRGASAHFFVDNSNIYQSVELRDVAWHCGTNGTYYHNDCRNSNSISIEMCCTAGNYKISDTTKKNAAYLCAYLCKMIGVTAGQVDTYVLRHYDITHKKCPAQMVSDAKEWSDFKTMVKNILEPPVVTTTTNNTNTFNVGEAVKLSVNATYKNGASIPSWVKKSTMYVREIQGDNIVISTKKTGAVTGVVNKKYLTKVSPATTTTSSTKPATNTTTSTLKVGDKVRLASNAVYTSGKNIPSWVKNKALYVRQLQSDNVVISTLKIGAVTGVVNKKYLTKC